MSTTIRNGKLFCLNCGGSFNIKVSAPVEQVSKQMKAFDALHKFCPKTWVEPKPPLELDIANRLLWWHKHGETGLSSITMSECLTGQKPNVINHPHDPNDFKRCYKLLECFPEWKDKIYLLKELSPAWKNLADNWQELTQMYEQNVAEKWKNADKIGMYEFMERLVKK